MKIALNLLYLCVFLEACSGHDVLVNSTTVDEVVDKNGTASVDKNGESAGRRGTASATGTSGGTRDGQLMVLLANRRKALMNSRLRPVEEPATIAPRPLPAAAVSSKTPKFNATRTYIRPDGRLTSRNTTDTTGKRREFRPGSTTKPTKPTTVKDESSSRVRNDTDDIFEVDESNQGLYVVNPKTLEYVPPNDSVPPNSNEVLGSDSRSRLSNAKDQSDEQDYDLASFQYFGQKISTPRSNETRSAHYRHNSPPVVRWRTNNNTKSSREDESSDMMDIGAARTSVEQNKIRHLKMSAQNRRLAVYNNLYRKSGASRIVAGKGNFTLANDTQSFESGSDSTRREITLTHLPMRKANATQTQQNLEEISTGSDVAENITTTAMPPLTSSMTTRPTASTTTKRSVTIENFAEPIPIISDGSSNLTSLNEETLVTTEASTEFLIIIPSIISDDESESTALDFNAENNTNTEAHTDNFKTSVQKDEVAPATINPKLEEILRRTTLRGPPKHIISKITTARPISTNIPKSPNLDKTATSTPLPTANNTEPKTNITVVYRTTSSSNNNTSQIIPKTPSTTKEPSYSISTTAQPSSSTSKTTQATSSTPVTFSTQKSTVPFTTTKFSTTTNSLPISKATSSTPLPSSTTVKSSIVTNAGTNEYLTSISNNKTQNSSTSHDTTTSKTTTAYDSILRNNNEVIMEIHRINMATYVLAGLGLVPVILITVYVVANLLNRAKKIPEDMEHCAKDSTPIANTAVDDECDLYSVTSEYHFDRANLRFKSILGEGNFGQVWKAEADDLTGHFGSTRIVAVKAERDEGGPGLRAEAEIMKKLGQHANVVTLLGLCMEQEPHLLIMEFAMRGRLLSLLRACKGPEGIREERDRTPPIANRQLTGFALDIAKGMEYIAAKKIVHRDLAARNVLIDHNGVCKICDFGMSVDLGTARVISLPSGADGARRRLRRGAGEQQRKRRPLRRLGLSSETRRPRPAMPIRWMAPEALQMNLYSTETDVWAFGVLLWEIFTLGCTPYPNLSGREVVRLVPSGLRLDDPRRCCSTVLHLMARCWKSDSAQRPSFAEARHDLAALHRAESAAVDALDDASTTDCFDVSGFSEDYENGVVYFDRRISEFECDI